MGRSSKSEPERTPAEAGQRFLVQSLVGALNTANGQRPLSRVGRSGVLTFFPSWLTSEMPLHAIGWQALATAVHARRGALRSKAGLAGLAVTAASWWGLRTIWQQGMASGAVFDDALTEALGDEADAELPRDAAPHASAKARRRQIVLGPANYPRKRWVHDGRLSYGEFGRRNQLDIWRSPDLKPGDAAPVLLQVHGGAWVIGNKDQQAMPLMSRLAEHGWVCVSINYRLSPRAAWPDHIVDVKRALAWIKEHIADYGGDPNFVAITGGSAGGHLCSLAALSPNEPSFQPGFEEADTSVACAVPFYGVYDFTNRDGTGRADMEQMLTDLVMKVPRTADPELWDKASSMSWVNPDAVPFFVLHGTNDCLVPVEQARAFVAMLRDVSKEPVAYAELPGAQHAFDVFASPRSLFAVDAVERFLAAMHNRYLADQPVEA
jgi:acetyl esterase/lipase